MELDDEVCLCFHVTQRKVRNYLRAHTLQQPSQLSECHGAGTGCGWCRPFLERLFQEHQRQSAETNEREGLPTAADYALERQTYLKRLAEERKRAGSVEGEDS
jgi:bacterioferritin-associated ferredoxin